MTLPFLINIVCTNNKDTFLPDECSETPQSRKLPFPLAPASQTVAAISYKIVNVLKLVYIINGIAMGLNHKLGKFGDMQGLSFATSMVFFRHFQGISLTFEAASLNHGRVLLNIHSSPALIIFRQQVLVSLATITGSHHLESPSIT